jgi:nitrate reductase delta subunit
MIVTLKAFSLLLSYPTEALKQAADEIAVAIAQEGLVDPEPLFPLLGQLHDDDLFELQERYVFLFDRSRTLSLNLFEHIHGESRDRGGAMVDLLETYRAAGMEPAGEELPDHLPILLEFLSTQPLAEARETLADAGHILTALAERLTRRDTAYAAVLQALAALAGGADGATVAALTGEADDDPADLAALDKMWEEAAVVFGPDPNAGCPATRDMLTRMTPERNAEPNADRAPARALT